MAVTPTHLTYYLICHRKLWLHANGITMEQTSDTVAEGKLISETTYAHRASRFTELDLGVAKIDFYDAKNRVVHEVKKSNKLEHAHIWQVKYYIYLLGKMGVDGVTGLLEYPRLRTTETVELSQADAEYIESAVREIEILIAGNECPQRVAKKVCRACSYQDFCWVGEEAGPDRAETHQEPESGE